MITEDKYMYRLRLLSDKKTRIINKRRLDTENSIEKINLSQ